MGVNGTFLSTMGYPCILVECPMSVAETSLCTLGCSMSVDGTSLCTFGMLHGYEWDIDRYCGMSYFNHETS